MKDSLELSPEKKMSVSKSETELPQEPVAKIIETVDTQPVATSLENNPFSVDKCKEDNGSENPNAGANASKDHGWSRRDDKLLRKAIKKFGDQGFSRIAQEIEGKSKIE